MAQQTLNATAGGPDDNLPTATAKLNSMFGELYALQSRTLNAADPRFAGATDEASIDNAINLPTIGAIAIGAAAVFIPASMLPYNAALVNTGAFSAVGGRLLREGGDSSLFDVLAYGATGDGSTDDTGAIQAALNAIQGNIGPVSGGGTVYFPRGSYRLTASLLSSTPGLALVGDGNVGQAEAVAHGSSELLLTGAFIGFDYGSAAGPTIFGGPRVENLHIRQVSGVSPGGMIFRRTNNWLLQNVAFSGFTAGYGFLSDGTGNINQYGVLINPRTSNCQIGIDLKESSGIQVLGGYIDGTVNASGTIVAGSTGVRVQSVDTLKIVGTVFQSSATHIDLQAGEGHTILGTRHEGMTLGINVASAASQVGIFGSNFNNFAAGGGGTGIVIGAGSVEITALGCGFRNIATRIVDNSTLAITTGQLDARTLIVPRLLERANSLTYGVTVSTNLQNGSLFQVTVTDGVAFTIANPTNAFDGQHISYSIYNASGGAMGVITWGSEFKLAGAFTNPATGQRRNISFMRIAGVWRETARSTADAPN